MRIAIITKESMYKLVKRYAGSVDEMYEVDGEYIEFEAGEKLMELCGMELE